MKYEDAQLQIKSTTDFIEMENKQNDNTDNTDNIVFYDNEIDNVAFYTECSDSNNRPIDIVDDTVVLIDVACKIVLFFVIVMPLFCIY